MIKLIKNEFRKFSNSYINVVTLAAMLLPLVLTTIVYFINKKGATYNWEAYIGSLNLFYGVFLGTLIPSFIAIFAIYNEFKEDTMKNLVSTPYSRIQIIVSKVLYVSIFVIGLYVAVTFFVMLSGILIGLDASLESIVFVLRHVMLPGLTTVVLIPLMVFLTLVFKNFLTPIIIAIFGTVVGIPFLSNSQSFFLPWLIPSNIFYKLRQPDTAAFTLPLIFLGLYFIVFFMLSIVRFKRMDFDS